MTTTNTNALIGLKMKVNGGNFVKLVCAKGRYIDVTIENDLYNLRAYNMKGVNEVSVKEMTGIFVADLQEAIIKSFSK